jgi:hypothetical protein
MPRNNFAKTALTTLTIASLVLTVVSVIAVPPAFADSGDYCYTYSQCGWCHSSWCPGGSGVLYNGNIQYCYNYRGELLPGYPKAWCSWTPCGFGRCE